MTTHDMLRTDLNDRGGACMALDERKRRRAPARSAPNRALRSVDPVIPIRSPGPAADADEASPTPETAIAAAVKAAYDAVDRNLEEGRAAAERLRAAMPPPTGPARDPRAIVNRLTYLTKDLGGTAVELIAALIREPEVRTFLDRLGRDDSPRGAAAPPDEAAPVMVSVTQRISSRRPIEVTLSALAASALSAPPAIAGVHALDAAAPSIRGVAFHARADGGLDLLIDVPSDQPPGFYHGAVADRDNHRAVGTLTIKVFE